jgi:hypothetical protein
MRLRRTSVVALIAVALLGIATHASAAPIPPQFHDSNAGAICVNTQLSGQPVSLLVQINFDPIENGGIDLATADHLFTQLTGAFPILSSILGPGSQITCSFKPSEVRSMFNLDAFQIVEAVSPSFQALDFSLYVVLDAYYWVEDDFLGNAETLRVDAFVVNGPSDLEYVASASVLRSLIP